jgi:maltose O-acetyltransferase
LRDILIPLWGSIGEKKVVGIMKELKHWRERIMIFKKMKALIAGKLRGETPTEKLIRMGLTVGRNFNRQNGCIIDDSHCWLITIGDNVTLAPRVHILAHDASTKMYLNYTKIGLVRIGDNVFIGANSVILPNVRIGNNVIIGAGCIVTKDIPDNSLAVGNPAKVIGNTSDYIEKNKALMKNSPVYNEKWTIRCNVTASQKEQMIEALKSGIGFVE